MATFLLVWNPQKWTWEDLKDQIQKVATQGYAVDQWSCGNRKNLPVGSRFFLIRVGQEPKGIVASGTTTSEPSYRSPHWNPRHRGKYLSVDVRFNFLAEAPLVTWNELLGPPFSVVRWRRIQAGGIECPPAVAEALAEVWQRRSQGDDPVIPEELERAPTFWEGAVKQVVVNAFERYPQARAACISYFGPRCSVCDLLMEERYGPRAAGFVHVHHITPLSQVGRGYRVNPQKDLRPLCPNCHAVIHLSKPPISIEEARSLLQRSAQSPIAPPASMAT